MRKRNRQQTRTVPFAALVAVVGVLIFGPSLAAAAAQAESGPTAGMPDRIAVLPLDIVGDIPAGRPSLEAAVLRGLTVAAAPTLPAGEAETRLRTTGAHLPCDKSECWSALGRAIESRFLIAGRVERQQNLFAVEFRVYDARSGRMLARESNACEADDCSVAELCRLTVRELARQTLAQLDDLPPTGAAPTSAAQPEAPAASPPVVDNARALGERPGDARTRKKWGAAAIMGGVVAAGAGAFLVHLHYSCADYIPGTRECWRLKGSDKNEALIGGIAAGAVGVGLVATGVVMMLNGGQAPQSRRSASALNLSVGPRSLLLSGQF